MKVAAKPMLDLMPPQYVVLYYLLYHVVKNGILNSIKLSINGD